MTRVTELWMRGAKLWVPALAFLLVNLGLLFGYRVLVQARVAAVTEEAEQQEERLAEAVRLRESRERAVATARGTEAAIVALRRETFGREAERLTLIMARVKELLNQAGLSGPRAINYSEKLHPEHGLMVKTIDFGVQGTYDQLRRFINFLELSESFLTLEEIGVTEGEAGSLSVRLRLSTLFDAPEARGIGRASG